MKSVKIVAPRAGAWIETPAVFLSPHGAFVAPRAGAWIETMLNTALSGIFWRRSPRGSVD